MKFQSLLPTEQLRINMIPFESFSTQFKKLGVSQKVVLFYVDVLGYTLTETTRRLSQPRTSLHSQRRKGLVKYDSSIEFDTNLSVDQVRSAMYEYEAFATKQKHLRGDEKLISYYARILGYTDMEISERLCISPQKVRTQLTTINLKYKKEDGI